MDYCYDVLINLNEDNVFKFYEWENYDAIELVKKIPLFKVSTKSLKDFYLYNVKVSEDFLNSLLDKTILKNNKINKTIKYACLLSDAKNALVVEFDEQGYLVSRSSLLLEDEANIMEFIYNYKETKIEYERLEEKKMDNHLRQENLVKKIINIELKTILDNNNESKLKYLFNEWFGYEEKDIFKMKEIMDRELKNNFTSNMYKIYNIIISSYNNV